MNLLQCFALGTVFVAAKSAPTSVSQAGHQENVKTTEATDNTRPTRSHRIDLDYIAPFDWNNDFLKYYNKIPLSYDFTDQIPNIPITTSFNFHPGYSSDEPSPSSFIISEEPSSISSVGPSVHESPSYNFNDFPYSSHRPSLITEHVQYTEKLPFMLYSKQLFFEDIPHLKLLLENQEIRKYNNLPPFALGSIRKGHPFERYVKK